MTKEVIDLQVDEGHTTAHGNQAEAFTDHDDDTGCSSSSSGSSDDLDAKGSTMEERT